MKQSNFIITIASTVVFALLFYKNSVGLNVAIFGIITSVLIAVFKKDFIRSRLNKVVLAGFALSAIAFGLYGSPFAIILSLMSFAMLFGLHTAEPLKNILVSFPNFFASYFMSWNDFIKSMGETMRLRRSLSIIKLARITLIPLLIIIVFIALYSAGSNFFGKIVADILNNLGNYLEIIFKNVNIVLILVLILGLFFSVIHSLKLLSTWFSKLDQGYIDDLLRTRKAQSGFMNRMLDLKYEYKSAVFLFYTLNALLLALLAVEIKNVWFGFSWEGEFLKPLVHEGTIVLIFTILISIALTAYFFRRNLNFYSKNKNLLVLAKVWIALNAVLVVSVAIRNYYYIQHFALAYKRIGVYFFLLLCFIGLLLLWYKLVHKKSTYYLIRSNAIVAYSGLILLLLVNWDVVIAKYNFSHSSTAFIHLDFMKTLSDKALPYLDLTEEEKAQIEAEQIEAIPFYKPGYFERSFYNDDVEYKKQKFLKKYRSKSWLEINLAERKAYELLTEKSLNKE